jgi:hypothetical protein
MTKWIALGIWVLCTVGPKSLAQVNPIDFGALQHDLLAAGSDGVFRPLSADRSGPELAGPPFVAYDNHTDPRFGGRTLPLGSLRTGGDEIGDDLGTLLDGPSFLDSAGYSITNYSATTPIQRIWFTLRWYAADGQSLLGAVPLVIEYENNPILPGSSRISRFVDGGFSQLDIRLESAMFMSMQFTQVRGPELSDLGMVVGGPITLGDSTRFARDFTTGQIFDLGASPQLNLVFLVKTFDVPSPGTTIAWVVILGPTKRPYRDCLKAARYR